MVTRSSRRGARRLASPIVVLTAVAALGLVSACDKLPLLAPAGTVITLFPSASSVPANGEIEIVATVIERGTASTGTGNNQGQTPAAGTPVHNGTLVSFTTTLGRIEPREARTHNGEVRVRFIAEGQSGTATITAYSGGASARLENVPVGAAAADRLIVSVSPQTLGPSGGTATVQARVETSSGAPVAGVPVTFSTTAGTVSPTTATTDENGVATTTVSTTREATVTATSGTKSGTATVRVSERSNLSVSSNNPAPTVGQPVTFTVSASPTAPITDAVIHFGDGRSQPLGTVNGTTSVPHVYGAPGEYQVTVTGRTPSGTQDSAFTRVFVGGVPATISVSPDPARINQPATLTVQGVSGAQVREYRWDFGDGSTATTGAPSTQHTWGRPGQFPVRVQIIGVNGETLATPTRTVVVNP